MFLYHLATVRPTETWGPGNFFALLVVAIVVGLLLRLRVRRRR